MEEEQKRRVKWMAKNLVVWSGNILRRTKEGPKLVTQQRDRVPILRDAHESMGHWDVKATKTFVKGRFWGPGQIRDTVMFVRTCNRYQNMGPIVKYVTNNKWLVARLFDVY